MSFAAVGAALVPALIGAVISTGLRLAISALTPDPPDINQQGPRLGDLKVQVSTYGNSIPYLYGRMRMAGNVIWSTDRIETATTVSQSSGGKGFGPSQTVNQTTYTYAQSCAIALCEGTIKGISKIWANGKLIYNLSDTADQGTLIASIDAAQSIRVYDGSETQTADALIQSYVGATLTPAYRGTAYVVFENLQLADFNNALPSLEFEVIKTGTISVPLWTSSAINNRNWFSIASGNSTMVMVSLNGVSLISQDFGATWFEITMPTATNWLSVGFGDGFFVATGNKYTYSKDGVSWSNDIAFTTIDSGSWGAVIFANGIFVAIKKGYNMAAYAKTAGADAISFTEVFFPAQIVLPFSAFGNGVFVVCGVFTGTNVVVTSTDGINWALQSPIIDASAIFGICFSAGAFVVLLGASKTARSTDGGVTWAISTNLPVAANWRGISSDGNIIIAIHSNFATEPNYAKSIDGGVTFTLVPTAVSFSANNFLEFYNGLFFSSGNGVGSINTLLVAGPLSSTDPALSSVVTDLCTRGGLEAGDINTSSLSATVPGYVITKQQSARAGIEPLMQAFYFDAVESDSKIKFVTRGNVDLLTIPEDDLAAHESGSAQPENLIVNRAQELDLPIEMAIQYADKDAAYEVGAQYSRRITSVSRNKSKIQLAMSMTATKAKQITDVLLYDAWTARTSFQFAVANKYSYLEPTDVVKIVKNGKVYTVRLTDKEESPGIHKFSGVLEDLSVYTQASNAASLTPPIQTVAGVVATSVQFLDIPLLRDQDDGLGFYLAANGLVPGWRGAQLFKSSDSGSTYSTYGNSIVNESATGIVSTILGNFNSGNIFDEINTVDVRMLSGQPLASTTELAVLNGGNAALIGNEIIQFKNATLISAATYRLSGLLRGRQGTEHAMSAHTLVDRFTLLSSSTITVQPALLSELGLSRNYKAVSFGSSLTTAPATSFTHNFLHKKCYSPVLLGGGRDASNNITLNWVRRTRISGQWINGIDSPLGEAAENYVIRIYTTSAYGAVARTINTTAQTASYTSAQQVTDFGSPQSTIYWDVAQVSAVVGNGYFKRGIT